MYKKITILSFLLCFACQNKNPHIVANFPQDQNLARKQYAGNMFGNKDGVILFEDKKEKDNNKNNIDKTEKLGLWKKSLYIIASILPISIADENNGLITTDWGKINTISENNNLYKINIVIKNNDFKKENIIVSAFKKSVDEKDSKDEKDEKVEKKIKELIFN